MAQVRNFKAGSVIYFEGESKDHLAYLLKSGSLSRSKFSLESGFYEKTRVSIGEFFGIKGALGVLPRDETIQVTADCVVLVFTPNEFVETIRNNFNIIFKMMQAFSNELRNIHKAIEKNMNITDEIIDSNANKLKNIGDYYFNKRQYSKSNYVYEKLLKNYPDYEKKNEVINNLNDLNDETKDEDFSDDLEMDLGLSNEENLFIDDAFSLEEAPNDGELGLTFNQVIRLYKSKHYLEAAKKSEKFLEMINNEYKKSDIYEKYYLLKAKIDFYNNDFVSASMNAKLFIKNYSSSNWIYSALLIIAESFNKSDKPDKAKLVYQKILSMDDLSKSISNNINNRFKKL